MKKRIISLFLSVMLIMGIFSVTAFGEGISVNVDGKPIVFDVAPTVIGGRTMVPLRKIFEAMGATVMWNDETKTVSSYLDATMVMMTIGSNKISVNGIEKVMDIAPMVLEGRTLVPARFVGEAFGSAVLWDDKTKTVSILSGETNIIGNFFYSIYKGWFSRGGEANITRYFNEERTASLVIRYYDDTDKVTLDALYKDNDNMIKLFENNHNSCKVLSDEKYKNQYGVSGVIYTYDFKMSYDNKMYDMIGKTFCFPSEKDNRWLYVEFMQDKNKKDSTSDFMNIISSIKQR